MKKALKVFEVEKEQISSRVRLNYQSIASKLQEGRSLFVDGMDFKSAHYARKRLKILLRKEVLVYPAMMNDGSKWGYAIELKKV